MAIPCTGRSGFVLRGGIRIREPFMDRRIAERGWTGRTRSLKVLLFILTLCSFRAAGVDLAFGHNTVAPYALLNEDYRNYLHFGRLEGERSAAGNFGFDLPALYAELDSTRGFLLGGCASAHLYMFPVRSKFHVDNFYATMALYLGYRASRRLDFRLYPYYHLSAHLSDGYPGDVAADSRAVSNEMIYLATTFSFKERIEFLLGYGYYYHTVVRKQLIDRLRADIKLVAPPISVLEPYIYVRNELIREERIRYGIEAAVGLYLFATGELAGASILFRIFDRPHPGQYFERYIRGMGVDFVFAPAGR